MKRNVSRSPPSPEAVRAALEELALATRALEIREAEYLASQDPAAAMEFHRAMGKEIDALLKAELAVYATRRKRSED